MRNILAIISLFLILNLNAFAEQKASKGVRMEKAMELAGFFAAHAIWSVSDGEVLIPMFAYQEADGKREMLRLVSEQVEDGVSKGKNYLYKNDFKATNAVLLYDGFVTLESGKTDAIILESRLYEEPIVTIKIIIPYRNAKSPKGFAVYRPKFVEIAGTQDPSFEKLAESFFNGVDSHEKGAAFWNANMDQSN